MNQRQFNAMQRRKRAAGEDLTINASPLARRIAARQRSGAEERQVDLLNDLRHGRINLTEYRELGGTER